MPRSHTIGIPWYEREHYAPLIANFDDGGSFPESYDEWLSEARKLRSRFESMGARTVRVLLDPGEFSAWCAERGLRLGETARVHYAIWFVTGSCRNLIGASAMQFNRQTLDNAGQGEEAGQMEFDNVPLSDQDMVALFDYLEDVLDAEECEHTFELTDAFLASHDITPGKVIHWLQRRGVVCDCDVLGEFEFAWRNAD